MLLLAHAVAASATGDSLSENHAQIGGRDGAEGPFEAPRIMPLEVEKVEAAAAAERRTKLGHDDLHIPQIFVIMEP